LNPCSQLSAVKKDSKNRNGAARKCFGPSYFVTALEYHAHLIFPQIPKLAMVKILQVKNFVKKICQNIQKYHQIFIKTIIKKIIKKICQKNSQKILSKRLSKKLPKKLSKKLSKIFERNLCRIKNIVPVCARPKDDLHSVKLVFVVAKKFLKRHSMQSNFWTVSKHLDRHKTFWDL
jgi:hypothetical protein